MTDWAELYRDNVAALAALAQGLTEDQLGTHLPATPAWTVHDVYAHLAGGPADALAGRMEAAPGPEWTARHVGERAGLPVEVLVDEIRANEDAVAASVVDNPSPALVWDLTVHHADVHEALDLGRPPERLWRPVLDALAPRLLSGAPAEVSSGDLTVGAGGPPVTVAPYELFRSLFSRRSRAQMRAWGAPALDDELLAGICVFGPRDDDQPVPD
ncbi:MAG: hypothetical protein JWO76_2 [Nocardioides sp.]|nr:hypothetical protein [Nocardioides sp.]